MRWCDWLVSFFHDDNQFRRPFNIKCAQKLLKSETTENIVHSPAQTEQNHLTRRVIGSAVESQIQYSTIYARHNVAPSLLKKIN